MVYVTYCQCWIGYKREFETGHQYLDPPQWTAIFSDRFEANGYNVVKSFDSKNEMLLWLAVLGITDYKEVGPHKKIKF